MVRRLMRGDVHFNEVPSLAVSYVRCVDGSLMHHLGMQDDDDSTWAGSEDGRSHSRRGSADSESSMSTILFDAAVTAETNDLAAQVGCTTEVVVTLAPEESRSWCRAR